MSAHNGNDAARNNTHGHNHKKPARKALTIPIFIGKLLAANGLDFPKDDGKVTVKCCSDGPDCIEITIEASGEKTIVKKVEGHLNRDWIGTFEGGDYVS